MLLLFLQRFFEAYIPSLPLMTVRDLQLAIVKEIWIKKLSCCNCRSSNKCFCILRDSSRCVSDSNRLCNIWILCQEVIRILTRRFKSLCLTFSLQLQFVKGFESITRRFESPYLVFHNSRFRDSNRCVGDSNRLCNIWILCQRVIRIRNSKIQIALSDLQPLTSICEGIRIHNSKIQIALPYSS